MVHAPPVQGLFLHDALKYMLVTLPEAAKLIAGLNLSHSRAGELDVKGRGGKVNLRGDRRKVSENHSWVGLPPHPGLQLALTCQHSASSLPSRRFFVCKITLLDLVITTVPSSYNLQQKNEKEMKRQKEKRSRRKRLVPGQSSEQMCD